MKDMKNVNNDSKVLIFLRIAGGGLVIIFVVFSRSARENVRSVE